MGHALLSDLVGRDQLPPLVLALSRLTGLPVGILDGDGTLLASSAGPDEVAEAATGVFESGVHVLALPIEVAGEKRATLVLGPYRSTGRRASRTASGEATAHHPPVLSRLRIEVVKARAQTLVQLLVDMGLRTLELQQEREERRRAEEALLARELQYRSLVEQMNEGILAGDADTRVTFVNPRMAALLGYSEAEMLGRPFYEFMDPDFRSAYLDRIKRRKTGVSEKYETVLVRKDGTKVWFLISAAPLRDAQGSYLGSFAMMSDISERKRAEEALRQSEEKFRNVFETMQDVYYRGDADGRLTLISPSGAKLLGYPSPEDLVGCDIAETMYLNPSDRAGFLAALHESGFVRDYEVVLKKRDGTPVTVSHNSHLNRNEQGVVTGVEGVFFDITERKRAKEELEKSEERYRLIVDNVQDIIFTHLPDGTISFVSGSVSHLGYRPEEAMGRNLFEFVHPDDAEIARNAFIQTLSTLQGTGIEVRVRCRNGDYRWMEEQSDPVVQEGRLSQVTCVLRDIEKRKGAEDALRLSEEKYRRIVNNIRDLVYSYFPDGTISFVSESSRRMGYDAEELTGRNLFTYVHDDDRERVQEVMEKAVTQGIYDSVQCRLRAKDGRFVWFEANSEPVFLDGRLFQFNGVAREITDRKVAEEALRLSEEKYRRIVNHIQDIIYSYQPDGQISFASESVRRLGYEPEELIGQSLFSLLHPDEMAGAYRVFRNAVDNGWHEHIECRVRTKGGGYVWVEENSEPIFQNGQLVQINAVARDITDRKAAELALRESEEKYRWLVEQLSEGIMVSNVDDMITFVNPRMAEMLGYTVEEMIGRQDAFLMGEEEWSRNRERGVKRMQGISEQYEIQLIRKDGSKVHFLVSGTPLRNKDGDVVGSFGVCSDITEWKRVEEELKRLSAAIEQVSDSIIITDIQGTILYANPASHTLTGMDLKELLGSNLGNLRSIRQSEAFYSELWSTVMRGETWSGRLSNVRYDGTRYETDTTMSPVRDASGQIQYVVTSSRDITREAELEVQLRHSQRMEAIGVMAGGIAHDFNNILTPVMGYTEMALNRSGLDAKVAEYLKEIASAGQRATELVQQILTFSRQAEQVKQPVQVDAIVKESLKLLRAAIPSTIAIRQRIGGTGAQTLGDPSQIHQVVMNLCTNAFHAMRERGGVMEVVLDAVQLDVPMVLLGATLPAGGYLRLRVSDSGRGIEEEMQKKIFLPFFTTKRVGEGTGLGLSIVHGIVMGMGGSIEVESEVGKGSTFTVYFPSIQAIAQAPSSVRPAAPAGSESLLVVDDEGVIGGMLQDALTYFGYRVRTFESPLEAWELFRHAPGAVDLIITDLTMPELTGVELARQVWALRPGFPVILMTGYTENLDEISAQEIGFATLLRKPVSLSVIGQTVRAVLDRKRLP